MQEAIKNFLLKHEAKSFGLALVSLFVFSLGILLTTISNSSVETTLFGIINTNTIAVILSGIQLAGVAVLTIFIPGRLLLSKITADSVFAYFSAFIGLFLILYLRHETNHEVDLLIYSFYTILLGLFIFRVINKKITLQKPTFDGNRALTTGIILFFVTFFFWLFVFPPYYDEFYRAQFVVRSLYHPGNENILFFPGGGSSNYYILLELLTGQISALFKLDYKIIYFVFFPAISFIITFRLIATIIRTTNTLIQKKYLIFIPILFTALISFYWQASVHLFLRQTINGFLFSILTLYLYQSYTQSNNIKERIMLAILVAFALFFTFYSKGIFGYALFPVILLIELIRKKTNILRDSLPLMLSITIVVLAIQHLFKIDGEGLSLVFHPLFNFINADPRNFDFLFTRIASSITPSSTILLIVSHFALTYLLRFNFQIWLILKGIIAVVKDFNINKFQLNNRTGVVERCLLTIIVSSFLFYQFFTISKYNNTGGADNYFQIFMILSSALYTLNVLTKQKPAYFYPVILLVLFLTYLPTKHNYTHGGLGSITNKEFLSALSYLEGLPQGIIIHNLFDSKQSVAISALTPHKQYMSYVGYGGVKNLPQDTIEQRKKNIHDLMDGKQLSSKLKGNIYILQETTNKIKGDNRTPIFENGSFRILKLPVEN